MRSDLTRWFVLPNWPYSSPTDREGKCKTCGASYKYPYRGGRGVVYCSEKCRDVARSAQAIASRERIAAGIRRNKKHATDRKKPERRPLHSFVCEQCGSAYEATKVRLGNRFCCGKCRDTWYQARRTEAVQKTLHIISCRTCRKSFKQSSANQMYCCRWCQELTRWARKNAKRRLKTEPGNVNPYDVFVRDGWRCRICGCDTPRDLRGSFAPNAPELDHIIPLGVGGEHSYENTQCACRSCNGAKGMKVA